MTPVRSATESQHIDQPERLSLRVAWLSNYVAPFSLPKYREIVRRLEKLTILISTPMEGNRQWEPDWGTLDVRVQKTITIRRPWRHTAGFSDTVHVHLPLDTVTQLRRLRPDVVVTGEFGLRTILAVIYARLVRRTPLILCATLSERTEHGRGWLRYLLRKWLVRIPDALITNGASGRRYLNRLGARNETIREIPYTCPMDTTPDGAEHRTADDAHRLLYVGQLIERKGLVPLLEALSRWAGDHPWRHVELTVVGSGPLQQRLKAMPRPENLHVDFAGPQPYDEVARYRARHGILVFPTLADEWGLVVNEAMAAGLPVLGSVYSAAVEELIQDAGADSADREDESAEQDTGWLFHTDQPDELYNAIDRAMNTPVDQLDRMRRNCLQSIARFTPAWAADATLNTIREVSGQY